LEDKNENKINSFISNYVPSDCCDLGDYIRQRCRLLSHISASFDDTLIMTGGTVEENIYLKEDSLGEIRRGYIADFLVLDDTSKATMYGSQVVSGTSSPEDG
jgi:hypothetical protein